MRTSSVIGALFPKTRQAILGATFLAPGRWWYMRELARHLRLTPSSLERELESLVSGGILRQKREGKHVYFQASTDSPIFAELRGLVLKTLGLAEVIRNALESLASRVQWAFLYDSGAGSGKDSAGDVHLMIVGQIGMAEVWGPLRKAEQRLCRTINPTLCTSREFAGKVKSRHQSVATVLRSKKLFLLGNPREFGRAFGKWGRARG